MQGFGYELDQHRVVELCTDSVRLLWPWWLFSAPQDAKGALPLPLIVADKTVDPKDDASIPVVQLETAMGAAVQFFDGVFGAIAHGIALAAVTRPHKTRLPFVAATTTISTATTASAAAGDTITAVAGAGAGAVRVPRYGPWTLSGVVEPPSTFCVLPLMHNCSCSGLFLLWSAMNLSSGHPPQWRQDSLRPGQEDARPAGGPVRRVRWAGARSHVFSIAFDTDRGLCVVLCRSDH